MQDNRPFLYSVPCPIRHITDQQVRSQQAVTNYCLTKKCEPGTRPEVMEALADIIECFPIL